MDGESGIAKYSRDFYNLVLKEKGYRFVDSNESTITILSEITSIDHVHIEIGIFQKKEIEIPNSSCGYEPNFYFQLSCNSSGEWTEYITLFDKRGHKTKAFSFLHTCL